MANFDPNSITQIYSQVASYLGISIETLYIILAIIGIWSLVWKGLALWKASKKNHMIWFIIILVINTIGILEILYIYVFSKMDWSSKPNKREHPRRKLKRKR
jgi:hypothetical protein